MATKTIYVSEQDSPVFEEARTVAGENLSSIIVRALREFLARQRQKESGFKEIAVRTGSRSSAREQCFYGTKIGDWRGFSDDRQWWMQAHIYTTQKNNWAVYLIQVCQASLLTDKERWRESGDYLLDSRRSDLLVAAKPEELKDKVPADLFRLLQDLAAHTEHPITYLDI
ncbi:EXLDI protein [Patescibacteria group bacterium]|nr:EXLDI protein [Patescibacteria group bacterium]